MGNCETKSNLFSSKELIKKYIWLKVIGRGGFGKVWLVEDKDN